MTKTNQGKLDEAEKMYQRSFQGYERAWGPDLTSTLDTVYNSGIHLTKSQDKLDEAEKVYHRRNRKQHNRALHGETWAFLHKSRGKLDEAEKIYRT